MLDDSATDPPGPRLRILFVTSDKFPPFRPAAKAIFADGLSAAGHGIDWVIQAADTRTSPGPRYYRTGIAFVAATNTGTTRLDRLRKYWYDFRNDLTVFRLLRENKYSLVQIKDKYIGALVAIAAAKLHRVPVFYWLAYPHGEASTYAAQQGVARYSVFYALRGRLQRFLLYKMIMPLCDHIFVQSEQMRDDVAREGISFTRMTAVPSSVNLAEIGPPADVGARRNTIVYLGTLLRERQLGILIRALKHVRTKIPDAELIFVGAGENPDDEAVLRSEAAMHDLTDAVTITGWLPMPDAWRHVREAGVCISPYYPTAILRSTSPTKLIEYMALGKPVVANFHPEQSDVVTRSGCGVLCDWSEAGFAEAIVSVLSDPESADVMGRAGRRFVEDERTHSVMVQLVTSTYGEVLRSRHAAATAYPSRLLGAHGEPHMTSRRSRGGRRTDD